MSVRVDHFGFSHYEYTPSTGTVEMAAEECLGRVQRGDAVLPLFFWFNGTLAPVSATDTTAMLVHRWYVWRYSYQGTNTNRTLLDELADMHGPRDCYFGVEPIRRGGASS